MNAIFLLVFLMEFSGMQPQAMVTQTVLVRRTYFTRYYKNNLIIGFGLFGMFSDDTKQIK